MRLKKQIPFLLVLLWGCLFIAKDALAQRTTVTVLAENADQITYELNAVWAQTLKTAIDSSRSQVLSPASVIASVQGVFDATQLLHLPALSAPTLQLVAADFDEISLLMGAADSLAEELSGPAVYVSHLGTYRKTPVASLNFKLLTYDPAGSTLRRYRRIVVQVNYARNVTSGVNTPAALNNSAAAIRANAHLAVAQSTLADGIVIKFPVTKDGLYRIDRTFLSEAGLNPDTIEPDNLQILGNGGAPLPALNGTVRPADLLENPVFVRGGGDGVFNEGDVLLFYGAGPTGWTYNEELAEWTHYVNPFSLHNYYFLKVAAGKGVRVGDATFPGFTDATRFTETTGRLFVDPDKFNWSKQNGSGLTWVSSTVDPTGRLDILTDSLPPGFNGGEVTYKGRVAINSNPAAFARFNNGGTQLAQVRTGSVINTQESPSARLTETTFTETIPSGQALNLSLTLEAQPNNPEVALDWMRAFYTQNLGAQNGKIRFVTPAGQIGRLEFVLSGFVTEPQVWDITKPDAIQRLGVQASGNTFITQVEVPDGAPRELIAFVEQAAVTLDGATATSVPAQNLHGLTDLPDFIIITPAIFKPYADELASIRSQEGLNVRVTLIDEVFNEFSGGLVDMRAVRDYLRFVYDSAPNDAQRLKYALFYGDGHFNYRGLGTDIIGLTSWIPPYATVDSFTPDETYTSDDYFGLLDADEGEWIYEGYGEPRVSGTLTRHVDRVDIGIGRFTVQTEEEAGVILEKIKHYENPITYGPWRSRYTFIADDGPTGLSGTKDDLDLHLQNADVVAELVKDQYSEINVKKIYASSFDRIFRNGYKVPAARDEIIQSLEEGNLLVNYSGHGGEEGLAQEGIFTAEDAKELENYDRLAIFVTATCSFGWWDLTNYQSGAEELLLNPHGGAVALLTTVRLVYTSADVNSLNVGLNRQLARDMFEPDAAGLPRRLGEVLLTTKNTRVGLQGNNRKFNLLGDPTMRVGMPANNVIVESINDTPLDSMQAQVRALDKINIKGSVQTLNGTIDEGFNGVVDLTIFDAERQISIAEIQRNLATPYYTVRQDLIWRGQVQASEGKFNATFVVPKDISYSNQTGRLSVYAYSDNVHALGYNENILVGGTSANPPNDNDGPRITLFLNDTTFVSGGLTSPEPKLIVKLFDESGINTVGAGVGHEMLLVVNDDEQNAVDISSGFKSETNSFQNGIVEWNLSQQQSGSNSLSLRAWDVLNNSTSATLDYFVSEDEDLTLENVYNYPNPTSGETRFVFEHNQPLGTQASIQIRIYTLSGRLIRTIESEELLPGGVIQLPWNGRDEDEDHLATGVYLYKLRVEIERPDGERQISEKIEKLAIIR